ncbi:MAG TPA: nucleotidyltransferase family protein [Symbiobacteriaceae bacterium]|jgi:CTP:molybdopterin cytidylyltransferase MocA|nr:nucleotidyltransferase family protein [Symbiobacteriaceae bacterium]
MNLAVLLLAAGQSTRMGARHKLLLPWGGGTVVGQALRTALRAPASTVVVVTGNRANEVQQACGQHERVRFVCNPRWQEGMFTSVLAGVGALPPGVDAFFVALGDMPLVPADVYAELARLYEANPGSILRPVFGERRGHPVLVPAALVAASPPPAGDEGLRGLLRLHADRLIEVEVPRPGVVIDLDTPEEYAKYKAGIHPEEAG